MEESRAPGPPQQQQQQRPRGGRAQQQQHARQGGSESGSAAAAAAAAPPAGPAWITPSGQLDFLALLRADAESGGAVLRSLGLG